MINDKILVTYASRRGATIEVARTIAEVLRESGANVNVRPMSTVHNFIGYRAVVLGSGVYDGKVLPEAVNFVHTHHQSLKMMPLGLFVVSMDLVYPAAEHFGAPSRYFDAVRDLMPGLVSQNIGMFAGAYEPKPWEIHNWLAVRVTDAPHGDFRDWDRIRDWAQHIAPGLALPVR